MNRIKSNIPEQWTSGGMLSVFYKKFGGIKAPVDVCMHAYVCERVLYFPQWGKSIFSLDSLLNVTYFSYQSGLKTFLSSPHRGWPQPTGANADTEIKAAGPHGYKQKPLRSNRHTRASTLKSGVEVSEASAATLWWHPALEKSFEEDRS